MVNDSLKRRIQKLESLYGILEDILADLSNQIYQLEKEVKKLGEAL